MDDVIAAGFVPVIAPSAAEGFAVGTLLAGLCLLAALAPRLRVQRIPGERRTDHPVPPPRSRPLPVVRLVKTAPVPPEAEESIAEADGDPDATQPDLLAAACFEVMAPVSKYVARHAAPPADGREADGKDADGKDADGKDADGKDRVLAG